MISKTLLAEFNTQVNYELYSAYLYLSMAAHFEAANMLGFAHWMKVQAKEEQVHGMKFYEYILDRGGKVVLQAIPQPPADFSSPLAIFEQVYEHEKVVTGRIHLLYGMAVAENDYAAQSFLTWFENEQVEEEKNDTQILDWLKMAADSPNALFMIDSMLGKRE
jgi:ferritin